ncbi:NADP-dependent oxidoreductase [Aurantiacibacter poecillastricola]|uniref:NADP-dependent oxidoreductase n=1 Tax=Aurantiacibacter poecillastricola TaxID=3064385 RepID=UPI00273F9C07|nr:NADP-dependent oxidoreductase [Aurantiacibacter sp. 219JJ12-13]MDP5262194.1 NADP-dependent oxidoreductase [Aurantiacibacter sp. 219JJ12-13]
MRALVMDGYGGPEQTAIRDVPRPEPAAGEVLVKVQAAGLNPVDYKTRDGKLRMIQGYDMPQVMGNELAGFVEKTGHDAGRFSAGDRVFARVAKDRLGALAEYAIVDTEHLAPIPPSLDFHEAAVIPLAGLTALQALRDELALAPGQHVFISAGAGGVGTFAIQIAKWLGARVTTTASPRGRDLVLRMGADRVIDYTAHDFTEDLRDVDAAFDLVGGETLSRMLGIVKRGGKVVSIAGIPEPTTARKDLDKGFPLTALFWLASLKPRIEAKRHGVTYRFLFMRPSGSELAELADLAEDGRLTPVIDRTFPFAKAKEAMAYLEKGHVKGKVVVTMD